MKVIDFNNFSKIENQKIFEMNLPIMKIDEILDDITTTKTDTLKSVLMSYFKTYIDYIDIVDKKTHIFKIYDMKGDVLNNNRVSFDVCIFEVGDMERIKNNLIEYSVSEYYKLMPNNINIFGIDLNPTSFINNDDLKDVFDKLFTLEETVKIITNIINYNFEEKYNDFYIWSKK